MGTEEVRAEGERPRVVVCGACPDGPFVFRKLDALCAKLRDPIICLQGRTWGLDKAVNQWAFRGKHLRKIFYQERGKEERAVREMLAYAAARLPSFVVVFGKDPLVEKWAARPLTIRRIEVR